MRYIIRTDYFLSEFLLEDIHDSLVIDVSTILNVKEKDKRKFIHKLLKYKVMPICLFIMSFCYRFFFRNLKNDEVLYFSIDRMDILSKLAWRYRAYKKQAVWLWNPSLSILKNSKQFSFFVRLIKLSGIEVWSFDESDCKKYALHYHPQIYSTSCSSKYNNKCSYRYDVLFIGQDKGRYKKIKEINSALLQANMQPYIYMIKDPTMDYYDDNDLFLRTESLSYEENIKLIKKSRALIDIVQQNQTGLTLRALEAVFFNKLLITNNKDIINYDFYDPELVFLLDEVHESQTLVDFLHKKPMRSGMLFKNSDCYDVKHLLKTIFERN
ncbi:hypothetical protein ACR9H8_15910 [Kosakonia cowanii]